METKNREKLLMIVAAACVALWLLNLLVISPLIDGWHSRSAEITRLKKQISEGGMLIRRETIIRNRWDSMRTNALAGNATAAERQLFTSFEHWVSASGVTEGSFRPQMQIIDTNYSTVDCRADVTGNIRGIDSFLKAMSRDPLAVKVESFDLSKRDDNGQQLTLGLNLRGLVLSDSSP
jgi:Tfp pilus assembly protein PilO